MFLYKNTEEDESIFLDSIFRSIKKKTKDMNPVIEIEKLTGNPNLFHLNNLMFYHWYERSTGKNVINKNVLSGLNPSNKYESKRTLQDEIIDRKNQYMQSARFDDFTVYYEYYYDFFPELEKLTFTEFTGRYFYDYLIELFPSLSKIDFKSQKTFFRYKKESKSIDAEDYFTLEYKPNNLPCFYPFRQGQRFSYSPKSLLNLEKNEVENLVRVEKGLPKVGEGWISETRLYYAIKEEFDFTKVIHHASPDWLGKQHFDIFIPEYNIAIEYQGVQHSRPVEFFGGAEAFEKNLERDERKRMLCEENDCTLIYAFPDDEHTQIINKIKQNVPNI
jgi:hypothetical protein